MVVGGVSSEQQNNGEDNSRRVVWLSWMKDKCECARDWFWMPTLIMQQIGLVSIMSEFLNTFIYTKNKYFYQET